MNKKKNFAFYAIRAFVATVALFAFGSARLFAQIVKTPVAVSNDSVQNAKTTTEEEENRLIEEYLSPVAKKMNLARDVQLALANDAFRVARIKQAVDNGVYERSWGRYFELLSWYALHGRYYVDATNVQYDVFEPRVGMIVEGGPSSVVESYDGVTSIRRIDLSGARCYRNEENESWLLDYETLSEMKQRALFEAM